MIVIVPNPEELEGLSADPYNGGPFVMWKGTPYVHIMVPVGKGPEAKLQALSSRKLFPSSHRYRSYGTGSN